LKQRIKAQHNCIILGGGGHARVLIDSLQMVGEVNILGILDPDEKLWGKSMQDIPILGNDERLPECIKQGADSFIVGLGSIGNFQERQRLYSYALSLELEPLPVIHPTATCSRWAKVGLGLQMLPRSIINAGAIIGDNVILNSGAIVEHDCVLGDHVHVATGAQLASGVRLGEGVHIGAGATVRQLISVGEGALVGCGAAVVKDVPPYTTVVGVPAMVMTKEK
jgi:UDP-perosamine 4-acetyltransferase